MASRLQRSHTERTSRVGKPTRHGRRSVRIGRRPAKTSVSLPPIRPLPENQRSSRLRATRATRVVFEVEENASDVSDEADIRPRQSRANCVSQVPVAARRVREFLREEYTLAFRHEHWHIGIVDAPIHSFLEPDTRADVHWFPLPGRGKYLADPFGLPRGDGMEVLFEEFDLGTRKGVISSASYLPRPGSGNQWTSGLESGSRKEWMGASTIPICQCSWRNARVYSSRRNSRTLRAATGT